MKTIQKSEIIEQLCLENVIKNIPENKGIALLFKMICKKKNGSLAINIENIFKKWNLDYHSYNTFMQESHFIDTNYQYYLFNSFDKFNNNEKVMHEYPYEYNTLILLEHHGGDIRSNYHWHGVYDLRDSHNMDLFTSWINKTHGVTIDDFEKDYHSNNGEWIEVINEN